jgi:hypothetical protein
MSVHYIIRVNKFELCAQLKRCLFIINKSYEHKAFVPERGGRGTEPEDVSLSLKRTKKLYTWKFRLDDKDHTIELFNSLLSGKKKVFHNKKELLSTVK